MSERAHSSNKVHPQQSGNSAPAAVPDTALNVPRADRGGCAGDNGGPSIQDFLWKLDSCTADVAELRRRQEDVEDVIRSRQEDAVRERKDANDAGTIEGLREQLEAVSDRLFSTEEHLRQTEERQDDAIAKANLTFQKHACDVENERQNLMTVVNQVNQNFQYLSNEIAEYGMQVASFKQGLEELQGQIQNSYHDMRNVNMGMAELGNTISSVEGKVQQQQEQAQQFAMVEQMVQHQQQQIDALMTSTQATKDAVGRMSAQNALYESNAKQESLHNDLFVMQDELSEANAQHQGLVSQIRELQSQVAHLLSERSWAGPMPRSSRFDAAEAPPAPPLSYDEDWQTAAHPGAYAPPAQPPHPHRRITKLVQDAPTLPIGDSHWPCSGPDLPPQHAGSAGRSVPRTSCGPHGDGDGAAASLGAMDARASGAFERAAASLSAMDMGPFPPTTMFDAVGPSVGRGFQYQQQGLLGGGDWHNAGGGYYTDPGGDSATEECYGL